MANKIEIINRIAEKSGKTKKATYEFMDAFKEVLMDVLSEGEKFHIHKVFTMEPVEMKERTVLNPKTLEKVDVPAHIRIKTVIGTDLKEAVNSRE